MTEKSLNISIDIGKQNVVLNLYGEKPSSPVFLVNDANEHGESPYQIQEGCTYEFKITDGYNLEESIIVSQSKVNLSSGRITPNIYVGTLTLTVLDFNRNKCGEIRLEVRSVKTTYRKDYRFMLEEITGKCIDLLLQHSSPVSQNFQVDFNADSNTLYQRFAFVKSILDSTEFTAAINKIIGSPTTKWKETETLKDIRSVKRLNRATLRQISSSSNRIKLPFSHPLEKTLGSIPTSINVNKKTETIDTPENRFVKHVLILFQSFCSDISSKLNDNSRLKKEAKILIEHLEQFLSQSIFKEISNPTTLPLNSPILQRKEGYREILRAWIMFDLAAQLIWNGGEDVYSGNKRDVAVLYEYWLFFKLLEIISDVFKIDSASVEKLIEPTRDGLGLKLKQGTYLPIDGIYCSGNRKLRVEFSYNKTFTGNQSYPSGGSWTVSAPNFLDKYMI